MNNVHILCRSCLAHMVIIKRFEFKIIFIKPDNKKKLKRFNLENKYLFGNIIRKTDKFDGKKVTRNLSKSLVDHPKDSAKIIKVVARKTVKNESKVLLSKSINVESVEKNVLNVSTLLRRVEIKCSNVAATDGSSVTVSPTDPKKHINNCDTGSVCSFPLLNAAKPDYVKTNLSANSYTSVKDIDCLSYPSVTKILTATMSEDAKLLLERWKQRLILEMGEEGFQEYSKNLLLQGVLMHDLIKSYLQGVPSNLLPVSTHLEGCWESLQSVLPFITDVILLEKYVIHRDLKYKGIVDCVAHYRGKPVIIDWKKSDKRKVSVQKTYDAPVQIAAYIGALNFDVNYPFKVNEGLVVVAYTDGSNADIFPLSRSQCDKYWKQWLVRLDSYFKF